MQKALLGLLLAAATATATAPAHSGEKSKDWTAEPTSFLGINISQSIEPSIPLCPDFYKVPLPKSLCHEKSYDGQYYQFRGTPDIGVGYNLVANTSRGAIEYIYLTAGSIDFDKLSLIFEKKYGQPTSRDQEIVKTGVGAEFRNDIISWKGKKVSIELKRYDGDINTSSATVTNNDMKASSLRKLGENINSAASKL